MNSYMLSFGGVDERLNTGRWNELNNATRGTISAWFMNTSGTWRNTGIFERTLLAVDQFAIRLITGSNVRVLIPSGTTIAQAATTAGDWALNTAYHVVLTFNGDENGTNGISRVRLYRNAISMSLGAVGNPPFPRFFNSSSASAVIGSTNLNAVFPLQGHMDEVAVWSGLCLSQSQINELFNSGSPSDLMSASFGQPTHWWRMGDGIGDVFPNIQDMGTNPMSATMNNMESTDITASIF